MDDGSESVSLGLKHAGCSSLNRLHQGPNELSINDPAAVQTVSGRLNRAPFYTGQYGTNGFVVHKLNKYGYQELLRKQIP